MRAISVVVSILVFSGCVSDPLPVNDSGVGDTGTTDGGGGSDTGMQDALADAPPPCMMPTPVLDNGCLPSKTPCFNAGMILCANSEQNCASNNGRTIKCTGVGDCVGQRCCIDPGTMLSLGCPITVTFPPNDGGIAPPLSQCAPNPCMGHQLCVSDNGCPGSEPHCHPAQIGQSNTKLGLCGP